MNGAVPLIPPCAFMVYTGIALPLAVRIMAQGYINLLTSHWPPFLPYRYILTRPGHPGIPSASNIPHTQELSGQELWTKSDFQHTSTTNTKAWIHGDVFVSVMYLM